MNDNPRGLAASPCINICQMDAATGWCAGCLRTLDEIGRWSSLDEGRRHEVLARLPLRRAQGLGEGRALAAPPPSTSAPSTPTPSTAPARGSKP